MSFRALDRVDPDIANLIRKEYKRQSETLELIASENLTSPAILEALGTLLTNKYAEGYPGRRYYGGTGEVIDKIETLAVERAKELFGAEYVNVQPHAGSQANAAVYMAVCQPGDRRWISFEFTMALSKLNVTSNAVRMMTVNRLTQPP